MGNGLGRVYGVTGAMRDGSARKVGEMMTVLVGGASKLWQYLGGEKDQGGMRGSVL